MTMQTQDLTAIPVIVAKCLMQRPDESIFDNVRRYWQVSQGREDEIRELIRNGTPPVLVGLGGDSRLLHAGFVSRYNRASEEFSFLPVPITFVHEPLYLLGRKITAQPKLRYLLNNDDRHRYEHEKAA